MCLRLGNSDSDDDRSVEHIAGGMNQSSIYMIYDVKQSKKHISCC